VIKLYGANWCPDCRRSKAFLTEQGIPFEYIDLEKIPEATAIVEELNDGKRIIPTIIFDDGEILVEPSNEELADKLELSRQAMEHTYDVIVVGGGPTGLTTAIYTARESLRTLVIEASGLGGQAGVTEKFENYPGFPEGISGREFATRIVAQAERFGVELLPAVGVTSVRSEGTSLVVETSTGVHLHAGAVVIATGSTYRRTGAAGESDLIGSGVHFCATCDGPFYRGAAELLVLGGGNSGLEEGLFLTQFADHVTVLERGSSLIGSKILQERVLEHPRMDVQLDTQVTEFLGDDSGKLTGVRLTTSDGATRVHSANGAFVFIGLKPNTGWLDGSLDADPGGFLVTSEGLMTSMPGVFAAGDVRQGSTKQLASAVGEGAAAAIQVRRYLDAKVSPGT
jgi:thioredoxin reductase (NADPH)